MMEAKTKFIIIDDDHVNNTICQMTIQIGLPNSDIKTFLIAEEGLAYISTKYLTTDNPTILLLDINMPSLSGWDFLDLYENLDTKIKEQIQIHMLSSSVDPNDKKRAEKNKNVKGFIEKPITIDMLQKIFGYTNN